MASKTTDQVAELYQAQAEESRKRERLIREGVKLERTRVIDWLATMVCKQYKETSTCSDLYCHVYEELLTDLDKENYK
jgi:hypothetical protein